MPHPPARRGATQTPMCTKPTHTHLHIHSQNYICAALKGLLHLWGGHMHVSSDVVNLPTTWLEASRLPVLFPTAQTAGRSRGAVAAAVLSHGV